MKVRKDIIEEAISKRQVCLGTLDILSYYSDILKPAAVLFALSLPLSYYLSGPLLIQVIGLSLFLMLVILLAMRKGLALQVLNIVVSPEDFRTTAVAFQKEYGGYFDLLEEDIFILSELGSSNFGFSILSIIRTNKQLYVNCRAEKGFFNLANQNKMAHYEDFFNALAITISGSSIIKREQGNELPKKISHQTTMLEQLDNASRTFERIFIYPLMLLFIAAPLALMFYGDFQAGLMLFVLLTPVWFLGYKYISLHLEERKQMNPKKSNRFH